MSYVHMCDYEDCDYLNDDREITSGGYQGAYNTLYHNNCHKEMTFRNQVQEFVESGKKIVVKVQVEKEVTIIGGANMQDWIDYNVDVSDMDYDDFGEKHFHKVLEEKAREYVGNGWANERGDDCGMFWESDGPAECRYTGKARIKTDTGYGAVEIK